MPTPASDAVSRVYAQSLFELAESKGQLDAIADEVSQLADLVENNEDLARLIDNPIIGRAERRGMIERLFQNQVSDLLYRFLQVLNTKGRLDALPGIATAFDALADDKAGRVTVDATVATPMDDATRKGVIDRLGNALGREVTLNEHLDESLIGGLKLRIGDQLIDASVSSRLRRMQQQLIAAGRDKARTMASR